MIFVFCLRVEGTELKPLGRRVLEDDRSPVIETPRRVEMKRHCWEIRQRSASKSELKICGSVWSQSEFRLNTQLIGGNRQVYEVI